MSDLDADLYGDLYGNDEFGGGDEAVADPQETKAPAEPSVPETKPVTAAVKETISTPNPAPVPTMPETNGVSQYTSPTFSQPQMVTQQIPTYEQPEYTDYREAIPTAGGYQNIQVNERSIRPSEMKDEGRYSGAA
ncbi:hypothetical protein H0H93_002101 [Arthromyces matolae]|nr:hypothetical protein H0H93_002101 [Arthromyces matolae]